MFLRGFGPILQAGIVLTGDPLREDPDQSVLALAERAGLRDGDRVLDAGCGVAGPATVIAGHFPQVVIDGITTSPRQAEIALGRIKGAGLASRIRVHVADYQRLPFRDEQFDQVLFFESTCYAADLQAAFSEAFRVLGAEGRLYVKDVFRLSGHLSESESEHIAAFDQVWGCVRSKTMEESVEAMTSAGFKMIHAAPLQGVGTGRLLGSMFELDPAAGLERSELGQAFWRKGLMPPIVFGEVRAVRSSRDCPRADLPQTRSPISPGLPRPVVEDS